MTNKSRSRASRRASRTVALLAALAALSLIGLVGLAQANDPTRSQYQTQVQQVAGDVGGGDGPSTTTGLQKKVVGGLPFTGLDVAALAAVAVALVSMGLALRRLTAERHAS